MLPALGAVSAALGVFKSLTTKLSSSEPAGFNPAPAKAAGNSTPSSVNSRPASGVGSGAHISPESISTLIKAQAQSSKAFSKDASVAYNAINQLAQGHTTAFQLSSGTLSINV